MPAQVIDLRTLIKTKISFVGYDTSTIAAGRLTIRLGVNLDDIISQSEVTTIDHNDDSGNEYILVGYSKVGDGSVFAP